MTTARTKPPPKLTPALTRVAVYTRKSTTDGLDQDFNSLDNQRQAIEAYITSQRSEGWIALPERYDDGGFTGANTDRPAFKRLLTDIEAGKVDVVAVYKLDRLSRSIGDFVGLMKLFEKHGVTFVSVTQNFSTTNAVGRMTMNLLVTFAEFERETISERTRDKMSAARRRGMWTGGQLVLGYDAKDKKLVVNPAEAEQARAIFKIYLETGSIILTVEELARRGWTTKSWVNQSGKVVRGFPFGKGNLARMLRNPLYIGKQRLRKETFDGQHEAILDRATWDAVQAQLSTNGNPRHHRINAKSGALLGGMLRCKVCGSSMVHSSGGPSGQWRYYVCSKAIKQGAAACPWSRVQRAQMEEFVVEQVRGMARDPQVVAAAIEAARREQDARRPELLSEARRLQQANSRLEADRRGLLDAIGGGGAGVQPLLQRLAEIDEELGRVALRQGEVSDELVRIQTAVVDEEGLRGALADFDGVWGELVPRERARLLGLLIKQVRFDGETRQIEIDMRTGAA